MRDYSATGSDSVKRSLVACSVCSNLFCRVCAFYSGGAAVAWRADVDASSEK